MLEVISEKGKLKVQIMLQKGGKNVRKMFTKATRKLSLELHSLVNN